MQDGRASKAKRRHQKQPLMSLSISILLLLGLLVNKMVYDQRRDIILGRHHHTNTTDNNSLIDKIRVEAAGDFWLPKLRQQSRTSGMIRATNQGQYGSSKQKAHDRRVISDVLLKEERSLEQGQNNFVLQSVDYSGRPPDEKAYKNTRLTEETTTSTSTKALNRSTFGRDSTADESVIEGPVKVDKIVIIQQTKDKQNSTRYEWSLEKGHYHAPGTPGAYLHIGKTGGSTISSILRNGCHQWIPKPCHLPERESRLSLLTTYYHLPDFKKLQNRTHHEFYVVGLRDPFDRLLSIYAYQHPQNVKARNEKPSPNNRKLYSCFPTLERFAELIGIDSTNYVYPDPLEVNRTNCVNLARAVIHQEVKPSTHFYWSIKRIHESVDRYLDSSVVFVVRQERLWQDWVAANQYLGQADVFTPDIRIRDQDGIHLPVESNIGEEGRRNLCTALLPEYGAYIDFLRRAKNLDEADRAHSLAIAKKNCPWSELRID